MTTLGSSKIWILVNDWSGFESSEPNACDVTCKIGPLYFKKILTAWLVKKEKKQVLHAHHYNSWLVYIHYPIFEVHFIVFMEFFSENSVLTYDKYSRAVCNQEQVIMARVWYTIWIQQVNMFFLTQSLVSAGYISTALLMLYLLIYDENKNNAILMQLSYKNTKSNRLNILLFKLGLHLQGKFSGCICPKKQRN